MKDYQLRLLGLGLMIVSFYGISKVFEHTMQFVFYTQQPDPVFFIIGMISFFGFASGFVMILLNYRSIRENYYQMRLEDFN